MIEKKINVFSKTEFIISVYLEIENSNKKKPTSTTSIKNLDNI